MTLTKDIPLDEVNPFESNELSRMVKYLPLGSGTIRANTSG